jgi:hypothetical protein
MSERLTLLGMSASPRKGGNSEYLLDEALDAARTFDKADVVSRWQGCACLRVLLATGALTQRGSA